MVIRRDEVFQLDLAFFDRLAVQRVINVIQRGREDLEPIALRAAREGGSGDHANGNRR